MTADFNPDTHMRLPSGKVVRLGDTNNTKRTDVWVEAFDGTYRLFLNIPQITELQRLSGFIDKEGNQHAGSIFQVYDRLSKGRYELEGQPVGFATEGAATLNDCLESVRLALVGGGAALVNGERLTISPTRARQLVDTYLAGAPLEDSWTLAFLAMSAAIKGREQKPYEAGRSWRDAVYPPEGEGDEPGDETPPAEALGTD